MKTLWVGLLNAGLLMMGSVGAKAEDTAPKAEQRSGLAKSDPTLEQIEKAITEADAKAGEVPPGELQALGRMIRDAPDAMLPQVAELALKVEHATLRLDMILRSFQAWAASDLPAAVKRTESVADPERGRIAWTSVMLAWRVRDAEACWSYLLTWPEGEPRDLAQLRFLDEHMHYDAPRSVVFAGMMKNDLWRERTLDRILWAWGEKDTPAALAWVTTIPDDARRHRLAIKAVLGLANKDRRAGAALAQSLDDKQLRYEAVNEMHQIWCTHEVQPAFEAFLSLPPDLQDKITAWHFGTCVEGMQTLAILGMAERLRVIPDAHDGFLKAAINRLEFYGRMPDAIRLLAEFPPGPERTSGLRGVAINWAAQNGAHAQAWVTGFAEGPEKQEMIDGLCSGLLPKSPEKALSWAEKLRSKEAASQLRRQLYAQWSKKDEPAAREWLKKADLSEEEKADCREGAELAKQNPTFG